MGSSQASEALPSLNTLSDLPSDIPANKILCKPPKSWLESGRFMKNKDAVLCTFPGVFAHPFPNVPGLVTPRPGRRRVSPGVYGIF